jgi:hypothetical protein
LRRLEIPLDRTGRVTDQAAPGSPRTQARLAGCLYLVIILGGAFAEIAVRARLFAPGDPAATAQNIQAHALLYRSGFVVELFCCACNVPLILLLYRLFKVVDRNVARMMVLFAAIADAIESVSLLAHLAPLILLGEGHDHGGWTAGQMNAAIDLSLQLFERGFSVSLVFFGFACLTMANLSLRSKFLPRLIGALLAIEGAGYLINSISLFIAPALQARIFPYFAATGVAELALCLWLLVMGVDVRRWHAQAAAAA